jgi:two-component system sensor histidine kinase NreB
MREPRVRAMVCMRRDMTESRDVNEQRRQLNEALKAAVDQRTAELLGANEALQTASRALEQSADSVIITDCTGVIEYVNPAFEAMSGYSREEAVGQTPRMVASKLHDQAFYETLWRTVLSGQVFRAIFTNMTKDGRIFYEDQTIAPVRNGTGTITHFVSTGRDITERRRTELALRRLTRAFEDEAARIATVLHDEAGQFLASAHIALAEVARDLPDELRERTREVCRHLDLAEEHLRRVSHELHPHMLDDLGLARAIRFLSNTFSQRTQISVDVDIDVAAPCPRGVETVFYRLVQEGLTNIGKHAKATRASIRLTRDATTMSCSIRDDGDGFDVEAVTGRGDFSLGLMLIRDRIEAVGGTLTIVSAPHQGTHLRATAPAGG